MKKIINGKKYDTETATRLGYWSNDYTPGDFSFCEETLYRKKTGEFFISGYGGPLTVYSRQIGSNTMSGGEDIRRLTEEEAREWAEDYLDCDTYENIFGPVEE